MMSGQIFRGSAGHLRKDKAGTPARCPKSSSRELLSVSSNPGDCVLDPFSGSGTTAAAAWRLGRNYIGIEISKKYVKQSQKRLLTLKKQKTTNLFLDIKELNELKRLFIDMNIPAQKIAGDKILLNLFVSQLSVRLNRQRKFDTQTIVPVLMDLKIDNNRKK